MRTGVSGSSASSSPSSCRGIADRVVVARRLAVEGERGVGEQTPHDAEGYALGDTGGGLFPSQDESWCSASHSLRTVANRSGHSTWGRCPQSANSASRPWGRRSTAAWAWEAGRT